MRKIRGIITIIGLVLLFGGVCAAAKSFDYNITSHEIILCGDDYGEFTSVEILPEGIDAANLTPEDVYASNTVLKTIESENGILKPDKIIFPDSFEPGRYNMYVFDGESAYKILIVYINQIGDVLEIASKGTAAELSSALISNYSVLALQEQFVKANAAEMAKYIYQSKPSDGYSKETFLKCLFEAEGFIYFRQNQISLDDLMQYYMPYIGVDNSEYGRLGAAEKETLRKLLKSDFAGNLSSLYKECLFLAKVQSASTKDSLKNYVLEYYKLHNLNLGAYENIKNPYYQDQVFVKLFERRSQFNSFSDFDRAFSDIAGEELNNSRKNKNNADAGGGGTGGQKMEITLPEPGTEQKHSFDDMQQHWAKDIVENLYEKGIVSGVDDNRFSPDTPITRAEFTKLIVTALNLEVTSGESFDDVALDSWFAPYVLTAKNAGIISGIEETKFMPDGKIKREDAAVILCRALNKKGITTEQRNMFLDSALLSPYAKEAVSILAALHILNGDNGQFRPADSVTRAEAATMVSKMLEAIENRGEPID